jgi:uncharacterized damage-inducible protein DinB
VIARIRHLTVDCREPYALARFWAEVLGYDDHPDDPNHPDHSEALIVDPAGLHPGLLFTRVPEPKSVKNRLHLDLQPIELRDEAVPLVTALGSAVIDDRRNADGTGWVVMADPEGNELCIERSAAERSDHVPPRSTGERDTPDVRAAGEREVLVEMLEWYRTGVVGKMDDLRPQHLRAQPLRSDTSMAGLLKHLALVEDSWFAVRFAGLPEPEPWASVDWDADRDWEFHSARDDSLETLVALYQAACDRSREVTAVHQLDDLAADTSHLEFNLRFALVHLIEETARHLGHLDVLRELLDGTTGE